MSDVKNLSLREEKKKKIATMKVAQSHTFWRSLKIIKFLKTKHSLNPTLNLPFPKFGLHKSSKFYFWTWISKSPLSKLTHTIKGNNLFLYMKNKRKLNFEFLDFYRNYRLFDSILYWYEHKISSTFNCRLSRTGNFTFNVFKGIF